MGQTLTHGVYLPDEGERNCYNGLAANWQLLDTSVGTIAEHTSALSGKAPLVHTHGNITNDGKVGTTANKPLITGTGGVVQAGSFGTAANTFCEGNDSRLSDARTPVAHTHTKSDVTDLFNSANTWTGENSFTAANINIKSSNFSLGDTVSSNQVKRFQWYDASNNRYACIAVNYATDKSVWIDIPLRTKNTEGTSFVDKTIRFQVKPDNSSAFLPVTNSVTDLGTSTNKWKTLNGINPGALSLPDSSKSAILDTTNWNVAGGTNIYTPPANGWLHIRVSGATELTVRWEDWRFGDRRVSATATDLGVSIPVVVGVIVHVITVASGFNGKCQFFPCQGNV